MSALSSIVAGSRPTSKRGPIGPDDPIPFGKHKGTIIRGVDPGWLAWARDKSDFCDPNASIYWPELRAAIVAVVGDSGAPPRPVVLALPAVCALLAARKLRIREERGEVILIDQDGHTGPTVPEGVPDALRVHKAALLAIIKLVEPVQVQVQGNSNGSAKFLWAADLRCRVKAWYGRMSRQFHPDAGGSAGAQTAVNQCYKSFMETLAEWEATK